MVRIPRRGYTPLRQQGRGGFTLIELLVVLAILALLLTVAAPKYIHQVERAREASLRASLKVMRDAIDKFEGDQGRLPASLDELVERKYLKAIPVDPITDRRDTWVSVTEADLPPAEPAAYASANTLAPNGGAGPTAPPADYPPPKPGIADVHSGATDKAADGSDYTTW